MAADCFVRVFSVWISVPYSRHAQRSSTAGMLHGGDASVVIRPTQVEAIIFRRKLFAEAILQFATSSSPADFAKQPRTGIRPMTFRGRFGETEDLRCFIGRQAGEVFQLHEFGLLRIVRSQL